MAMVLELKNLIELSLKEILSIKNIQNENSLLHQYTQVLFSYLTEDLSALTAAIEKMKYLEPINTSELEVALLISEIRLAIRQGQVKVSCLQDLYEKSPQAPQWQGEAFFVLAFAYETLGDHPESKKFYQLSYEALTRLGSPKKAVKALHNIVAAESRIHPEKKLLAEYHNAYQRAREVKEYHIAGVALLNISREYQLIGARYIALKYCKRALKFLEREFGCLQFYLALVHRCHLLCELGRFSEAELDYQLAELSDFPEVKASLVVVSQLMKKNTTVASLDSNHLLPTWKERLNQPVNAKKLTVLENKLIEVLGTGSLSRIDLIGALYGSEIDFELAESRLKVLLNRFRKKQPSLVVFENGKYRIADDAYLEIKKKVLF